MAAVITGKPRRDSTPAEVGWTAGATDPIRRRFHSYPAATRGPATSPCLRRGGAADPRICVCQRAFRVNRGRRRLDRWSSAVGRGFTVISKRTTLILGAGASAPYGFPLGIELRDRLLTETGNITGLLDFAGLPRERWKTVQRAFLASQYDSVDDFLARYGEHSEITKLIVAYWINFAESAEGHLRHGNSDHWYRFLLLNALQDDPTLGNGKLSIITFNYDLSLETYCFEVLTNRHRLDASQARDAIANLKIAHVYGSLGPLDTINGKGRRYGPLSPTELPAIAKSISTCHEPESVGAVADAQQLIRESEVIIFLGFGYSKENLARLDFGNTVQSHAAVLGSVYKCPNYAKYLYEHLREPQNFKTASGAGSGTAATDALASLLTAANNDA
jgi:hypothetical protein